MDIIKHNGKEFPSRTFLVKIDDVEQEITIADTNLSEEIGYHGVHKDLNTADKGIDDSIYFYVEPYVMNLPANVICAMHLDTPLKFIEEIP